MTRVRCSDSPIYESELEYARQLLDSLPSEVQDIADSFYGDTNDQCRLLAEQSGYSVSQCAAVTALYSINQSWNANVTLAHNALVHDVVVGLKYVKVLVRNVLDGQNPHNNLTNGSKVNAFYRALMGDPDACVCDRWVFRVFGKPQSETWYGWVVRACRQLAAEYGVDVATLQARLWYAVILDYARRGDKGGVNSASMLGLKEYV